MQKIGLIAIDETKFPNLPLMKISAFHKNAGDIVEWYNFMNNYDRVYISKIFTYSSDYPYKISADQIVRGGTGYDLKTILSEEIEHVYPDYRLYPANESALGFLSRGCPRGCSFCIVTEKEGFAHKVADLHEWYRGQKRITLLDPNILATPQRIELLRQLAKTKAKVDFTQGLDIRLVDQDVITALRKIKLKRFHFAWDLMQNSELIKLNLLKVKNELSLTRHKMSLYILTNYNTSIDEDFERVGWCLSNDIHPYVMVYNKQELPAWSFYKSLQAWTQKFCYTMGFYDFLAQRKSPVPPEFIGTRYEKEYMNIIMGNRK
jgi:hypothetical protein